MRIHRSILFGATLAVASGLPGCSAVPTRPIDCTSLGRCEPLQFVFGQPDEVTNTRLTFGLAAPASAIASNKRLIVTDTGQNRVLIWQSFPPNVNQPPDLVLGQPDLTTSQANYGGLTARSMWNPSSLASDGTRLVVADTLNHRLLV